MGLRETFQKQGGMKLIRQYIRNGTLITAVVQFLLLGKGRTGLEILRLSTQYKTKKKLEKKYAKNLKEFDEQYDNNLTRVPSNKVWICWLQGIENAPEIVKLCYESVKKKLIDKEVVLLTAKNIRDYVSLPDYILQKWKDGVITNTHLTDLLRLELLIKHGGMWLDATVLCSERVENIPTYFFDSDLFFYQNLKPGRDGDGFYISSWLMSARTNNKILMATRLLCYEYWKRNSSMDDYYLLHAFMSIVLDHYPEEWNAVIPRNNAAPHMLLLRLFDQYNEKLWIAIKDQTPFHKLSYKYNEEETKKQRTFYKAIVEGVIQ